MEKWNKLSSSEKMMIVCLFVMLIAIGFSWKRIVIGVKKGITPFNQEQPINKDNTN